jgi:sugar phosphate isomerase/epimerase
MNQPERLLSLASGVLPEFSPEQTAAAAVAAGWDAVGLWVEPPIWTAATTRGVRDRLGDAGLRVLDVEVVWIKPGPLDPDHLRILDIGVEVGAENVLVVSSDPDMDATAAKLTALVDHARGTGLRVALEFAAFTHVRGLADAMAMLARPGLEEATLLVDPLHFARTGGKPHDLADVPASRFTYAQFCDAPAHGPHPDDGAAIIHEAIDLRLMPGDGELPLAALLEVLPPRLPLSVELRSKALRDGYSDPGERAAAVLRATLAQPYLRQTVSSPTYPAEPTGSA